MPQLLPLIVVLLAGIGVAVQTPTNAALARVSGSVLLAALISVLVSTVVLVAAWVAIDRTPASALRGAPPWAWIGGLYGAFFLAALAYAAPRLGLAATLTLLIASQLVAALMIDHFGMFGLKAEPISLGRVAGVVLVLAGVILVRRG